MKITQDDITSIALHTSSGIETQTDITVSEKDLAALKDWIADFVTDQFGVEITEEEEPFEAKKFLTLPTNCHYGVVGFPRDVTFGNELHGPFLTETEARQYIHKMWKEYEDYERFAVCKIELPVISPVVNRPDPVGDMLYRQDARP